VRRFLRALREAIAALRELSAIVDPELICKVIHADVLSAPDIGEIDLVVSSPPYPNAYSYHLYHMTRMLWLGMDQATFKLHEIGSHRKYSSNGPNQANAETFRRELTSVFRWLRDHLRKSGYLCFVIGNSIIEGQVVANDQLAVDAASSFGFTLVVRISRTLKETKKSFNPKIGKIKQEQIIILRRDR
jgi:site-specific DNA-methyltransferase (cytosine-N4-specific)